LKLNRPFELRYKQARKTRSETALALCAFNAPTVISNDDLNAPFRLFVEQDLDGARFTAIRVFDGIGEQLGYDQTKDNRFVRWHRNGRTVKLYVFAPLSPPRFNQAIANLV
jgi:hypothetical protein